MSPANALPPPPMLSLVPGVPAGARAQYERPLPLLSAGEWRAMVNRQLGECRRQGSTLAVVAVTVADVRRLDAEGAHGGPADAALADRVRENLTQRLRTRVRSSDRVVRIGVDQLGLLLCHVDARLAAEIEARVAPALAGPCRVDEHLALAQLRCGMAVYPSDGATTELLLGKLSERLEAPAPQA